MMASAYQSSSEDERAERRAERPTDMSRAIQASSVLQAVLGIGSEHERPSNVSTYRSGRACSFPKPPHVAHDPAPFIAVAIADNGLSEDTAWWDDDDASSTEGLMMACTGITSNENERSFEDVKLIDYDHTPQANISRECDSYSQPTAEQTFAAYDSYDESLVIDDHQPSFQRALTTPLRPLNPFASPPLRQVSTAPPGVTDTAATSNTSFPIDTPYDKSEAGRHQLIMVHDDDDDDVVLGAHLHTSPNRSFDKLLRESLPLFDKDSKLMKPFPMIKQQPPCLPTSHAMVSMKHKKSISTQTARSDAQNTTETTLPSMPAVPEIIVNHADSLHMPWERIERSTLPFTALNTSLFSNGAYSTVRRMSQHPPYWNSELAHDVAVWLTLSDTVVSYMSLHAVHLSANPSLSGRAAICHGIHARTGHNAVKIDLINLVLPRRARNVFNPYGDLEWFVIHIVWKEVDGSSSIATTITFPKSYVTHTAIKSSPFDMRDTQSMERRSQAYRFLLGRSGPSPVACGSGLDEWALEEFMAACARGDGVIIMSS